MINPNTIQGKPESPSVEKKTHIEFKLRWDYFIFIVLRYDPRIAEEEERITNPEVSLLDVLFDIGFGRELDLNHPTWDENGRLSLKNHFFFRFGLPRFGIQEGSYQSTFYFTL